jgi:hypothetical protein
MVANARCGGRCLLPEYRLPLTLGRHLLRHASSDTMRHKCRIVVVSLALCCLLALAAILRAKFGAKLDKAAVSAAEHSRPISAPRVVSPAKLAADCEADAAAWKSRLRRDCRLLVAPPFVLAGDMELGELDQWRRSTIEPAAEIIWRQYASTRPDQPVTILLFASERRYRTEAERLFADRAVSPYGYYKPSRRCVVLNLSRGGGTLLHELTHALISFDFPNIPDWFNEGLASLHEECSLNTDTQELVPLVNWRLPPLQAALRQGRLPSVMVMVSPGEFLRQDVGMGYAHARYLCMYLHRQGKLATFYRRFRDASAGDPSGLLTLLSVTDKATCQQLDAEFRNWVAELK